MRTANLSEAGLLIQVDIQELQILAAALSTLCNVGDTLNELEQRSDGAKDKAETLLISIRSLNALVERLMVQTESPSNQGLSEEQDTAIVEPESANGWDRVAT